MKRLKSIMVLVTLILLCSLAIAEEKELFKPAEGGSIVCENCLSGDVCKGKITSTSDYQFNCDKTCTIKMKDKAGKEMWSMRLNGACVSFNEKGYPEEIKALKDLTEDLNINGYLTKMKANDYVWFEYSVKTLSNDINSPKINIYGSKEKDGSISPFTICDQTFYPRSHPMTSEFKVSRPLKKDGKSYGCEINFYQLYNMNDVKKDKEGKPQYKTYYQKCGDISYNAYDNGINSMSCEPKVEYTDNAARKTESRLYCSLGNSGCKQSSFTISVYGQSSGYPLSVQIRGGQYADKTNFKGVISKKDLKSQRPMKVIEADNFAIGSQSFNAKPKEGGKPEVTFVEEDLPTMYVPNGIEVYMHTDTGSFLTYKYLPEFSRPVQNKFEGYLFRFDPQKQYPSSIYPANFDLTQWNIKNMAEAKLFAGSSYHAGLKPQVKFEGGQMQFKGKDGNTYSTYKNIIVEWRVNPDMLEGMSPKKDTITTKPCIEEGCTSAITANKQCGPVTVKAEMDYASISDYVTAKLGYVKPKVPVVAPKPLAPIVAKPSPATSIHKPTATNPTGKKRVGGKRGGGKGGRIRPEGESEEEMAMMEPGELTAEQKANVAKFVTIIIKLNEKKKLKDAEDTIDDNVYYAAEVSVTRDGKEYMKVWSHFPTIKNDKKVDGVKKDDMFKAPSELLYPNKCKGQVNIGASKNELNTAGLTKFSAEDATKWKIECKDNKFIRTTDNKEYLPDKEYCLIEKKGTPGNTIYNYKCVDNEPYYKSKKCTCTANADGTGQCVQATSDGTGTSKADYTCNPPDYINLQGDCVPVVCKNNEDCTRELSSNYICNSNNNRCICPPPYVIQKGKCDNSGTVTRAATSTGGSCSNDAACDRELVCGLNRQCVKRCANNGECNAIYNDKLKYTCDNFRCETIKCSPQNYGTDCNTIREMTKPLYACENGLCTKKDKVVDKQECNKYFEPPSTGSYNLPSYPYYAQDGRCYTGLMRCTDTKYCKTKAKENSKGVLNKFTKCADGFCVNTWGKTQAFCIKPIETWWGKQAYCTDGLLE